MTPAAGHRTRRSTGTPDLVRELEDHAQRLAEPSSRRWRRPTRSSSPGTAARLDRGVPDTVFHLQHLAAALDVDDPGELHRYRRWLSTVLAERYGAAAGPAIRLLESCQAEEPG